ncbi:alpha/beta hydrolase [Ruegeria jejuensis]|uniref:alpha/beta hydrolase n=1 Tax=Ruegeria jejuensis TaxID=3233338 RepID=UPI00355B0F1A
MANDRLNPELADAYRWLPVFPYFNRATIPLGRFLYNMGSKTKAEFGATVDEYNIGPLLLRVFRPIAPALEGGVLWIHGGGFIAGTTEQVNEVASRFARWLRVPIVTVEYRWAPENPYPAALDDVHAAWQWMLDAEDIDSTRMAILGQSGGGGLAAALVNRIHDEGGQQPVAQVLHYPMLDDRTAADRSLDKETFEIWNNRCNKVAWNAYLHPAKAGDAYVSEYAAPARREELSGLPPTWIGVGTYDLFSEETRTYADRLIDAGVPCETMYVDGAPHVFEIMAPEWKTSGLFLERTRAFLKRHLASGETAKVA